MLFKHLFTLLTGALTGYPGSGGNLTIRQSAGVSVQLIRNATVRVTCGKTTFLVDPMLSEPGSYPGFPGTCHSELRNPLVPLPIPIKTALKGIDAVILTHTHLDHWDKAAQEALSSNLPFFVQDKKDADLVRSQGFENIRILEKTTHFNGVTLTKTSCQHGSRAMYADPATGEALGSVMGIVFRSPHEKTVYLAGDTIWFGGVDEAITHFKPDILILNAGAAAFSLDQFKAAPEIIMGKEDMLRASQAAPDAKIIAVHLDAINHMTVNRKELLEYTTCHGLRDRVLIPLDGEIMQF